MSNKLYIAFNGASPTTAAQVKMAVGTSIHTILQVATPSTCPIIVVEWGISFDGAPGTAVPVNCELIDTDVAATAGTSLTPTKYSSPASTPASLCVGGTGATMFSDGAVTEGTITASRVLDAQLIAPTNQYIKQFPLGREPSIDISRFLRVRVTAPAAVNALAYIIWEE